MSRCCIINTQQNYIPFSNFASIFHKKFSFYHVKLPEYNAADITIQACKLFFASTINENAG